MEKLYNKSIQMIKRLNKIPSHKEWNEIAKEKKLLSYLSLQYISNEGFYTLCKNIRRAK